MIMTLEKLKELCDGTMKGPWEIFTDSRLYLSMQPVDIFVDHGSDGDIRPVDRANLNFIAAAHAYMPKLIEALEVTADEIVRSNPEIPDCRKKVEDRINTLLTRE